MNPRCAAAVVAAGAKLGRTITTPELKGMDDRVRENLKLLAIKDPTKFHSMSQTDRFTEVGKMVADQLKHEAIKKAQRAELQVIAQANAEAKLTAMVGRGETAMRAIQRMFGYKADGKGGVQSIETRSKVLAMAYGERLRALFDMEREGTLGGLFTNREGIDAVVREMKGESTGNANAVKAAKAISDTMNALIDHHASKGGDVGKLKGWLPQKQDQFRVYGDLFEFVNGVPRRIPEATRRDRWVSDALQHIDRSTLVDLNGNLLDDVKAKEWLNEAWDTIVSDGYFKGSNAEYASTIANRHKQHRQLHWKNADSYLAMMDKYGGGSLLDQITGQIQTMSRDIALMEEFGPNALHTLEILKDKAKAIDKKTSVNTDDGMKVDAIIDYFSGRGSEVKNMSVHKFFRTIHDMNTATLLGSILSSQLADNATAFATARALNMSMSQWGIHKTKFYGSPAMKDFARSAGVAFDMMIDSTLRYNDNMNGQGFWGKMASATMKVSGSQFFTAMHRSAFSSFVLDQVGGLTRKREWSALDAADKSLLESKGFTETDWAILRAADVDTSYGGTGLGNTQIAAIPLDKIKALIPAQIAQIHNDAADFLNALSAQNLKEADWVANRKLKFDDYKTRMQKMMDDYEATREKRKEELSAAHLKRAGELQMRTDAAEIDIEIATENIKETNAGRASKFMEDVKRGIENYGRRRSEIGEKFGAQRHAYKLQQSAIDRSFAKLSDELSAKFAEKFGLERTVDGFKEIGEVTKAAKEMDAYVAKMETRIANSHKKDGTVKKGKEGTVDRAEKLKADAELEFQVIKQKATDAVANLREKLGGTEAELEGLQKLLDVKKERAGLEADIASYLATEKNVDKVQSLLDTLTFRSGQGVDRAMSRGEQLGYRKAMNDYQMRAMNRSEFLFDKQAGKEVFAKASDIEKRVDKHMTDLEEFSKSMSERAAKRDALAKDYAAKIGDKENAVAEEAKRMAASKLTGYAIEEAEMAVLQPSMLSKLAFQPDKGSVPSELGAAVMQFKSFPWAFLKQHLVDRAGMQGGVTNRLTYTAGLLAASSVMGGLGLMMNDIAQGKDPREVYDPEKGILGGSTTKFAMAAMVKGGGLSFLGDVLNTDWEGRDPIEKMIGPAAGKVHSLGKLGAEITQAARGESDTQVAKRFLDTATTFTPMQNLLWTRGVFHNVLMGNLNEMANPGYQSRMNGLAEKNYNSGYYMGMGQPARLPNLMNPVGVNQ
jgi:hypothetical protein